LELSISKYVYDHRFEITWKCFSFFVLLLSGMRQVPDEEVIAAHRGTKLSVEEVGYLGMTTNMFQFVDIFSIPEITILRDVIQVDRIKSK